MRCKWIDINKITFQIWSMINWIQRSEKKMNNRIDKYLYWQWLKYLAHKFLFQINFWFCISNISINFISNHLNYIFKWNIWLFCFWIRNIWIELKLMKIITKPFNCKIQRNNVIHHHVGKTQNAKLSTQHQHAVVWEVFDNFYCSKHQILKKKLFSSKKGYVGNPLSGCRHECESDGECGSQEFCKDFKCQQACSQCGISATCARVSNHRAICECPKVIFVAWIKSKL